MTSHKLQARLLVAGRNYCKFGFRLSHRQALEVARLLRPTAARISTYDDASLQALVLRDERAARDFMLYELGPLLARDNRTAALLDTLRAYVDSGWKAASAGARLGVHERTVGYRLVKIEQRLSSWMRA